MNLRQWKKFTKQNITKISADSNKSDILLLEFDMDKISLQELHDWYNSIKDKINCSFIALPKGKLQLQSLSVDELYGIRQFITLVINAKMRLLEGDKK